MKFYSQMFHIVSMLLQVFFHTLQLFSNLCPKSAENIEKSSFFGFGPQNSSPNTSKLKTFPCTGAGNNDKYSPLSSQKKLPLCEKPDVKNIFLTRLHSEDPNNNDTN